MGKTAPRLRRRIPVCLMRRRRIHVCAAQDSTKTTKTPVWRRIPVCLMRRRRIHVCAAPPAQVKMGKTPSAPLVNFDKISEFSKLLSSDTRIQTPNKRPYEDTF
jgi:hypothetical protein